MTHAATPLTLDGRPFEDTIDGYFPLCVSLQHMLARRDLAAAIVTLEYAPIMHIPDLADDAAVPINIRSGIAGIISKMTFCVTQNSLCGVGRWKWFSEPRLTFQSMTRLAEPCFLTGFGFVPGFAKTPVLGHVAATPAGGILALDDFDLTKTHKRLIGGPFRASEFVHLDDEGYEMTTKKNIYFVQ